MSYPQDLTLAGLVHDLKNVFETIHEAAEILRDEERWSALAAAIERSIEQGRRITESLQESAETFDLETVLENAVQCTRDFASASQRPQLHFVRRIDPGIRLAGRPGAWERVFVNLFLNAAHAMPDGGSVEIAATRREGSILLTVSDTGPGIPSDILERVFTPGFSTRQSHTGLGLSIVESIVRAHGGTVRAGNRDGVSGASFVITTPEAAASIPQE